MEFSKKMLVLHSFVTVSLITATVVINIATEHDVTALAALAGRRHLGRFLSVEIQE